MNSVRIDLEDEATVRRLSRIRRAIEDLVEMGGRLLHNGQTRPKYPLSSLARAGVRELNADADWIASLIQDSALAGELGLVVEAEGEDSKDG